MRYALADVMIYVSHNRRAHQNVGTCLWHVSLQSAMFQRITQQRHVPTLWRYCFERFDTTSFQEIILSSGFFRRETASGFYPWGNVEGPRKRVAEELCGWRHGNSFPMPQSAQSHRQMRSIPRCSKAIFYVFVFDYINDSATKCNHCPTNFPMMGILWGAFLVEVFHSWSDIFL